MGERSALKMPANKTGKYKWPVLQKMSLFLFDLFIHLLKGADIKKDGKK